MREIKPLDCNIMLLYFYIIVLQLIYLTKLLYSFINIEYLFLYGIIGFMSLTFLPGILLLRVLKIHNLSLIETTLYATGLSLTFDMILALFINTYSPSIGIENPFSFNYLYCTFVFSILILCILAYIFDRDFKNPPCYFDCDFYLHPLLLALVLLLLISIFGTYLMNLYSNNMLQLTTLIIIGLIVALYKHIPSKYYSFTLFIISISLLFHKSLISSYVHGWDIQLAYRFSEATQMNNYWDYSQSNPYNSLLAFPVLSTVYSNICGINIHMVYKIIYSFLFSLAPVGLFTYYKSQFDSLVDVKSFLSTLVFIFYYQFNSDIVDKQKIAEFFFILLLLLTIDQKIRLPQKKVLLILFSFSLIQSHYGLSYILIFCFVFSYAFLSLTNSNGSNKRETYLLFSPTHICLFLVMTFAWYSHISSGRVFDNFIHTIEYSYNSIVNIFISGQIETRTGIDFINNRMYSHLIQFNALLFITLTGFIIVGAMQQTYLIFKHENKPNRAHSENSFIPLYFLLLLGISFFISGNLGVDRIYQIALVILAPFSIFGYQLIYSKFQHNLCFLKLSSITGRNIMNLFSVFLLLLFLFNSGLIYYANNVPISSNFAIDPDSEYAVYDDENMNGALWLKKYDNIDNNVVIYTDYYTQPLLFEFFDVGNIHTRNMTSETPYNSYYYRRNAITNKKNIINNRYDNKIYTTGNVDIFSR